MTGLDRNELGMFLVEAGLSNTRDHALACLLALNGLRVSEALGADIGDMGLERGHHTFRIIRKGGKSVLIPMGSTNSQNSLSMGAAPDSGSISLDKHFGRARIESPPTSPAVAGVIAR